MQFGEPHEEYNPTIYNAAASLSVPLVMSELPGF
jgi:hypothetical protein